ncbi:Retrovirus-related Pol polyprotein from transposon 17.6 Protease [Larimichthys crocea]|uniref:Gypsy retrotransposon integrase-like protein 1 n=1 Tax=Larimichthys crocea TaxID=215358 RepID=A0A6G0J2Y4_LARCR|nr:Retrovirus-related Pol polyprotein from transposon 17.6 Protease [Larimichthys crocea]
MLRAVQESHLEEHIKPQLHNLLGNNVDVCTTKVGRTGILKHQIFLTSPVPIRQKPYRVSPPKQKVMKELIEDMLKDDVIEPSYSAWASPVVLIPKREGKPRFCVDFRKVNENTVTDAYPIPTIQEILESLSGAVVFSSLDLNSGYWQVEMDPEVREVTAFICSHGLFQFKVMPFGLKNAPATFQRLMERALGELKGVICFVYLDDIIIFSSSWEQHSYDVQAVLDKLQNAGLTVNMKKSKLFRTSLKFLGHIVSATGVQVDPDKIEAVQNLPAPTNLKALQRFLGMAGWYHRFVPNFSQIAEPLNALNKKGAKFRWSPECQTAFITLKNHLVKPPVLAHPNFNAPFVVYTDASEIGLGAVLVQKSSYGTEEVLAFASRSLNPAEKNYAATELECLAVVWAVEKWRTYLEGRLFTVVTDHASLLWVFKTTKPSTRLIRWALRLQEFTFTVEYRKGKYNTVPDALSRAPTDSLHTTAPVYATVMSAPPKPSKELPISIEALWRRQQEDPECQVLYQQVVEMGQDNDTNPAYIIMDDLLYRCITLPYKTIYQLYIPPSFRSQLLDYFHQDPLSGHLGRHKTYRRLQHLVFWPKLSWDVREHVKNCATCQRYKPENRKLAGKLQQTQAHRPWEMLGVDLMGPFPKSSKQNVYLLVFVDYFSRWVELFPIRNATAETISQIMVKDILTRWGIPDYILSDRGTQFVSSVFQTVCRTWNVGHKLTSAYHPQTNLTERVNRTLKTMIASYVGDNHKHWDKNLAEFRFAINSAVQESTGVSPAELNLGRSLRGPLDSLLQPQETAPDTPPYLKVTQLKDLCSFVEKNLDSARQRQKRNYDKHRRDLEFQELDRVWLRAHPLSKADKSFAAKLAPKWQGPYRVVEQVGPVNYKVVLENSGTDLKVVHISRLKPCYPTAQDLQEQEKKHLLEIFNEESDEEDFLGFTDSSCSTFNGGLIKGSAEKLGNYNFSNPTDSDND